MILGYFRVFLRNKLIFFFFFFYLLRAIFSLYLNSCLFFPHPFIKCMHLPKLPKNLTPLFLRLLHFTNTIHLLPE